MFKAKYKKINKDTSISVLGGIDGQTAFDRPEVTAAVFKSRLDQMKINIRNGKYFDGRELICTFYVIEYQYRGLPHAHLVVPSEIVSVKREFHCYLCGKANH